MKDPRANKTARSAGSRRVGLISVLAGAVALLGFSVLGARPHGGNDRGPCAVVGRMDLNLTVRASGVLASAVRTVVRCPVENVKGKKAATTVLELAAEGSVVKRGDVLCRLDQSDYEELERRQVMILAQARADHQRASLDLDAARTALAEYRDGRHRLEARELEGRIETARAQVHRLTDRLDWSRRMLARGYASRAQVAEESNALKKALFEQSRAEREFRTYQDHRFPRTILELKSRVEGARADLMYQSVRLRREEERLAALHRQVELCTIRAPHDGLLLYAHKPKRNVRIEEGMPVHQNQELFYLPDLSRLELQVLLHETVVAKLRPGMPVRFRLEGSPGERRGTLAVIDPLPVVDRSKSSSGEVKNYMGRIPVDSSDRALVPGATVEAEILTDRVSGALVVPADAPRRDRGRDVCDVLGPVGFETRAVTLGRLSGAWREVLDGIAEGEEVALSPPPPP